ncbi:MAG: hypothetical protein ACI9JN_002042 [Bacteroidia bacterium]
MIGLLLLYFVGKQFYDLAKEHGRHKWGYATLGVLSHYGGLFFGALVIIMLYDTYSVTGVNEGNETLLGLSGVPIGILTCVLLYKYLSKKLNNKAIFYQEDVLDDIGINEHNN